MIEIGACHHLHVRARASAADSNLPDSTTSCVLGAFEALSFPAPEGGIVTVTYPIVFSPY